MAVNLSPLAGAAAQFFDNNGVILAGGKIYTYSAGTTTPIAVYTSSSGSIAHTNPIILDSAGRVPSGEIWITSGVSYKFVIYTTLSTLIGTYDNISFLQASGVALTPSGYTTATDVQTAFDNLGSTAGTSKVGFIATGSGAVSRSAQSKLRETVSVEDFGAVGNGTTDDTSAIQAALDSGAATVELTGKVYVVNGTLTVPPGVTIMGQSIASEYYPSGPGSTTVGSCLSKLSTGTNGPIVILKSSSGIANCYLKHSKVGGATTGIIQIGLTGNNSVYNSNISNVNLYGSATTDLTGATTCYGIYYPNGSNASTYQRYFNRANNFYITNCDVAIRLGSNCNANSFTSFVTRQSYQHILLDGISATEQCVENTFTGFLCSNIGALPTSPTTVFTLKNYSIFNVFTGFVTESNGTAFSIDSTSNRNIFTGNTNEITPSYVPPGGISGSGSGSLNLIWSPPQNIEQFTNMMLPSLSTGSKYDLALIGSRQSMIQQISTGVGLPTLDGAGTLVAATTYSRNIIQLNPDIFIKSGQPNFRGTLTLWVSGSGTRTVICTVQFGYVVNNATTNAGIFEVYDVRLTPSASNFVSGLYFITGAVGATSFKIAMVGGNSTSAPAQTIIAALDLDVFAAIGYARDKYFQHTFISSAVSANDVTNAISMLTVAETAV